MTVTGKLLVYLGTALIAAFAAFSLYSIATKPGLTAQDIFGGLAMLGLLLVLVGSALRQAKS